MFFLGFHNFVKWTDFDWTNNGFSPKIVRKSPDLRIFTEIRILRIHSSDFDDIFTIGSVFAFRARCRTPFPADFAKNAVSENFYCQFFSKIFVQTFAKIRYVEALWANPAFDIDVRTMQAWIKTVSRLSFAGEVLLVSLLLYGHV